MADDRKPKQQPSHDRQPSQDEQYLKLLKGEITSKEFVKDLKDEVRRRDRSTTRRVGADAPTGA